MDGVHLVKTTVTDIAARWKQQYCDSSGRWGNILKGDTELIYRKLSELPNDAVPADTTAIIGNDSWMGARCTFCETITDQYFQIGQEPDYESATIYVRPTCAVKLAEELLKAKDRP